MNYLDELNNNVYELSTSHGEVITVFNGCQHTLREVLKKARSVVDLYNLHGSFVVYKVDFFQGIKHYDSTHKVKFIKQ